LQAKPGALILDKRNKESIEAAQSAY